MLVPLRGRWDLHPYWVIQAAVLGSECPVALEMWMSVQHSSGQGGKRSSLQNRMSVNSTDWRVKDVGSISGLPEEPSWRSFTPFFVSSEFSCWMAGSRVVSSICVIGRMFSFWVHVED